MYIVIDVGGTSTRVASSMDGKTITRKKRFWTPKVFKEGVAQIAEVVEELRQDKKITGVVIGIPGTIEHRRGKTIKVPNLPSWEEKDLSYIFQTKLGRSVKLANDAELGALGEAVFGAGKAFDIVAYLTVSTGIGGALVVAKKLLPRTHNTEPGHIVIDLKSNAIDGSGRRGTLEALASGTSFEKRFGEKAEQCKNPETWKKYAQILGEGIINIIMLWSPGILVIGGGFSRAGDLLFNPLRQFVEENLKMFPPPPIVPAELGDDAGLYGGFVLLKK